MEAKKSQQASALIFVMAVLFLFATIGLGFARFALLNQKAALSYVRKVPVKLLSEGGIEYAVARLRKDFARELVDANRDWHCWAPDNGNEDNVGIGVSVFDMANYDEDIAALQRPRPSYQYRDGLNSFLEVGDYKYNISGYTGSKNNIFTLKILDTNSQLNLNSCYPSIENPSPQDTGVRTMSEMLVKLIYAIETHTGKPYSGQLTDPLFCSNLIRHRNSIGGFTSKLDLLKIPGIDIEDVKYIWDYYTVYPHPSAMNNNLYRVVEEGFATSYQLARTSAREQTCRFYQSPININTASWPVLMAVIWGLATTEQPPVTISKPEATQLVNKICARRQQRPFAGWDDVDAFLEAEQNSIFSGDSATKVAMFKQNCNPSVIIRGQNVDKILQQKLLYIANQSTHLCFFPYGMFEITCLAQILDSTGAPQQQRLSYALVRIYDLICHTTQQDFENNQIDDFTTRTHNRSFTSPINLQAANANIGEAAQGCGYVQPITYGHDAADASALFGHANIHNGLTLRAFFNNDIKAICRVNRNTSATQEYEQPPPPPLQPQDLDRKVPEQALVSDGLLYRFQRCFRHKASKLLSTAHPGELPYANAPAREGIVSFWFKINQWEVPQDGNNPSALGSSNNSLWYDDARGWKTVFFATTPIQEIDVTDPLQFSADSNHPQLWVAPDNPHLAQVIFGNQHPGNGVTLSLYNPLLQFPGETRMTMWTAVIQMQVEMKYSEQDRELRIRAIRKLVKWPLGYDQYVPDLLGADVDYINTVTGVVLGGSHNDYYVRPYEWYHVAIGWQDYTNVKDLNQPIVISGVFENDGGEVIARGPLRTSELQPQPLQLELDQIEGLVPNQRFTSLDTYAQYREKLARNSYYYHYYYEYEYRWVPYDANHIPHLQQQNPSCDQCQNFRHNLQRFSRWIVSFDRDRLYIRETIRKRRRVYRPGKVPYVDSGTGNAYSPYNPRDIITWEYKLPIMRIFNELRGQNLRHTETNTQYSNRELDNLARDLYVSVKYMQYLAWPFLPLIDNEVFTARELNASIAQTAGIETPRFLYFGTMERRDLLWEATRDGAVNFSSRTSFAPLGNVSQLQIPYMTRVRDQSLRNGLWQSALMLIDRNAAMTLDDIGLSTASPATLQSLDYNPSRYPFPDYDHPDAPTRQVAVLHARFQLPESTTGPVKLGYLYWTARETEDIVCDATDVDHWQAMQGREYSLKVWREMWMRMTDMTTKPLGLNTAVLNYQTVADIEVTAGWKTGTIAITTPAGPVTIEIHTTTQESNYQFYSNARLYQVLWQWYLNYAGRYGLGNNANVLIANRSNGFSLTNPDGSAIILDQARTHDYAVRFLVRDSLIEAIENTASGISQKRAIFRMAVIEDVIMSYQGQIQYKVRSQAPEWLQ